MTKTHLKSNFLLEMKSLVSKAKPRDGWKKNITADLVFKKTLFVILVLQTCLTAHYGLWKGCTKTLWVADIDPERASCGPAELPGGDSKDLLAGLWRMDG